MRVLCFFCWLKSVAGFEDVAFTTAGVKQFIYMSPVDLFSQPVHVDLDRVGERIEGVVPHMRGNLRPRNQMPCATSEIFQQCIFLCRQLHVMIGPRDAMA